MPTTASLVHFLKNRFVKAAFLDKLKITYRPFICPFDELLALVEPNDAVFDIGCGSGQFALLVAEFTQAKSIMGVDIKPHLIENARNLSQNYTQKLPIHFEKYDGINFPKEIQAASLIFLIDVLHHISKEKYLAFLQSVYDNMPQNATFVIKDIDGASPFVYFNKLHDLIFSQELVNEISLAELRTITEKVGFQIISFSYRRMYVYPHYTLIMRKGK
jgi:cyclopropane fatty-acyl-phospholipid synthase-like methyltransferase